MPKYTATFLRITFLYKIIHVININATFKIYVKFTFINVIMHLLSKHLPKSAYMNFNEWNVKS